MVDPNTIKPVNVELNPNNETVIEGKNIRLTATAIDKDGNRFAMDPDKLFMELSPPDLAEWKNGKIKTKKSGTLTISYQYLDIKKAWRLISSLKNRNRKSPGHWPGSFWSLNETPVDCSRRNLTPAG